jgi:signal transduction histidine kinase
MRTNGVKRKSITGQITWSLFLICTVVFAVTELFILERTHSALSDALDKDLKTRAEFLRSLVDIEDGVFDFDEEDINMPDYLDADSKACFLILVEKTHVELGRSPSLGDNEFILPGAVTNRSLVEPVYWTQEMGDETVRCIAASEIVEWDDEDDDEDEDDEDYEDGPSVYGAPDDDREDDDNGEDAAEEAALGDLDRPVVRGIFIVGVKTEETEEQFMAMFQRTAMALGFGLILLLWTGRFVLLANLKYLKDFNEEVRGISSMHLEPVSVPEVEEIASVAETLNRVVRHLDEAFRRERQFTSNVSHELRTPISEILSCTDVALEYPDNLDADTLENYKDIHTSGIHMQGIVENLLLLSRFDSAQLKIHRSQFEVRELIESSWDRFRDRASAREVTFRHYLPEHCVVYSDEHMFQTIIDNLLSNAVAYSASGGTIEMEMTCDSIRFEIILSNPVMDLVESDLPYLFNRFWRKKSIRSTDDSHSGLGLSIVKSLAVMLDFNLSLQMKNGDIFQVVIQGQTQSAGTEQP